MALNSSLFLLLVISIGFSDAFILQNPQNSIKPLANWERVESGVNDIQLLIVNAGLTVINIAAEDNYDAAIVIAEFMYSALEESMALLGIVEGEIASRTLTVDVAKVHLGELFVIVTDYYSQIKPILDEFGEEAHAGIDQQFSYLFLGIPAMAEDVYEALEEPTPPSCGIVGYAFNSTVSPAKPLDSWTPPGTTFWSARVENVKETFLLIHAHNKYLDSEVTTGAPPRTISLTTSQNFPTVVDETGLEVLQRTIMFECFDGSNIYYKFEININTDPIEEPTLKPVF